MFHAAPTYRWTILVAFRHLCITACLLVCATTTAHARCTGEDILPRLTKSHPAVIQEARAAAKKIANTGAILWRIEKSGLKPSHLFGTMHVSDKRITEMPAPAATALRNARLVALEIADMSSSAMMAAVAQSPQLMVYMDGTRLDQKLPAEEFSAISKILLEAGMPPEMSAILRPWMVNIILAVPPCELLSLKQGGSALDSQIEATARASNKQVVGLETIESQLKALVAVPEADQIAMLRTSIAFIKDRENLFETMIQAYLKRDLGIILSLSPAMAQVAGIKDSGMKAFSRELLIKRNHIMFKASRPLVDQGNAFIAVGAGHLIDETGLVELYRKAGFTVTAVN